METTINILNLLIRSVAGRNLCLPIVLLCVVVPSAARSELIKLDTQSGLNAVYLFPDPEAELVKVSITILAGEVDFDGPKGLSHYLEHLMFWHADRVNDDQLHARGGNAWVNGLITNYFNQGEPSESADMFEFARRLFTEPTLDERFMLDERKVVSREYDLRVSDNPDWRIITQLREQLYGEHPVSRSVIGTPESIMSLTLEQALDFHQRYYHPANAVLLVSGNITADEVQNLVKEKFGQIEAGYHHSQDWRMRSITGSLNETRQFVDTQVNYERLAYGSLSNWPGREDALQDSYTAMMLAYILESALPGSLAKPLRLDNFVVSGYELGINKLLNDQIEFLLFAIPDEAVTLDVVSKKLQAALVDIAKQGIPDKTIERVRKRILQTERRLATDPETSYWRIQINLSLNLAPNTVKDHLKRIENVAAADVNSLLRIIASPERKITAFIKPKGD